MAVAKNLGRHEYRTLFGVYQGSTWINENNGTYHIRCNGTFHPSFLGFGKEFGYTLMSKKGFDSVESAESYLEKELSKVVITKAMWSARNSTMQNAKQLDPDFIVF